MRPTASASTPKSTASPKSSPRSASKLPATKPSGVGLAKKSPTKEKKIPVSKSPKAPLKAPSKAKAKKDSTPVAATKPDKDSAPPTEGVAHQETAAEVSGQSGAPPEISGRDVPPVQPSNIDPDTAERVGQIISSQTSLSKELQSKLPRVGEAISGSGNGAAIEVSELTEAELEAAVAKEVSGGDGAAAGDLALQGQPSSETVGTSVGTDSTPTLDSKAKAASIISTELQDLPENFSKETKEAREEERRREEEEREERSKVSRKGHSTVKNLLCTPAPWPPLMSEGIFFFLET